MDQLRERVFRIIVEHLGVDEKRMTEDASFVDDLGADSLDIVELVMAFEEEFGIEISDDAAEKIITIRDVIGLLRARSLQIHPAEALELDRKFLDENA